MQLSSGVLCITWCCHLQIDHLSYTITLFLEANVKKGINFENVWLLLFVGCKGYILSVNLCWKLYIEYWRARGDENQTPGFDQKVITLHLNSWDMWNISLLCNCFEPSVIFITCHSAFIQHCWTNVVTWHLYTLLSSKLFDKQASDLGCQIHHQLKAT